MSFNGNSLLSNANANFTSLINRYNYFTVPDCIKDTGSLSNLITDNFDNNIHVYSFCINPNSHKLSGFASTSKFNNVVLDLDIENNTGNELELSIYQIKHNIIRIENGILNILFN